MNCNTNSLDYFSMYLYIYTYIYIHNIYIYGRWSKLVCLFFGLPAPFRETYAFFRAHSGAHMVDNPPSTTPLKPCVKSLLWEPTTQPECYFPSLKQVLGR